MSSNSSVNDLFASSSHLLLASALYVLVFDILEPAGVLIGQYASFFAVITWIFMIILMMEFGFVLWRVGNPFWKRFVGRFV